MAINTFVEQLCLGEEFGFVSLWGCLIDRVDMYTMDGIHLTGNGAVVFVDELSTAVDSGMGRINNIV